MQQSTTLLFSCEALDEDLRSHFYITHIDILGKHKRTFFLINTFCLESKPTKWVHWLPSPVLSFVCFLAVQALTHYFLHLFTFVCHLFFISISSSPHPCCLVLPLNHRRVNEMEQRQSCVCLFKAADSEQLHPTSPSPAVFARYSHLTLSLHASVQGP